MEGEKVRPRFRVSPGNLETLASGSLLRVYPAGCRAAHERNTHSWYRGILDQDTRLHRFEVRQAHTGSMWVRAQRRILALILGRYAEK